MNVFLYFLIVLFIFCSIANEFLAVILTFVVILNTGNLPRPL